MRRTLARNVETHILCRNRTCGNRDIHILRAVVSELTCNIAEIQIRLSRKSFTVQRIGNKSACNGIPHREHAHGVDPVIAVKLDRDTAKHVALAEQIPVRRLRRGKQVSVLDIFQRVGREEPVYIFARNSRNGKRVRNAVKRKIIIRLNVSCRNGRRKFFVRCKGNIRRPVYGILHIPFAEYARHIKRHIVEKIVRFAYLIIGRIHCKLLFEDNKLHTRRIRRVCISRIGNGCSNGVFRRAVAGSADCKQSCFRERNPAGLFCESITDLSLARQIFHLRIKLKRVALDHGIYHVRFDAYKRQSLRIGIRSKLSRITVKRKRIISPKRCPCVRCRDFHIPRIDFRRKIF